MEPLLPKWFQSTWHVKNLIRVSTSLKNYFNYWMTIFLRNVYWIKCLAILVKGAKIQSSCISFMCGLASITFVLCIPLLPVRENKKHWQSSGSWFGFIVILVYRYLAGVFLLPTKYNTPGQPVQCTALIR